jgi:hypothetical protein
MPFIEVGPHTVLHPFQVPGVKPPSSQPLFQRGRLDHFALNAASEEAFYELRLRIVAEGAGDGVVTDMGSLLNFGFTDPDGGQHEVIWVKPGVPVETGLWRAEWRSKCSKETFPCPYTERGEGTENAKEGATHIQEPA